MGGRCSIWMELLIRMMVFSSSVQAKNRNELPLVQCRKMLPRTRVRFFHARIIFGLELRQARIIFGPDSRQAVGMFPGILVLTEFPVAGRDALL